MSGNQLGSDVKQFPGQRNGGRWQASTPRKTLASNSSSEFFPSLSDEAQSELELSEVFSWMGVLVSGLCAAIDLLDIKDLRRKDSSGLYRARQALICSPILCVCLCSYKDRGP